MVFKLRSPSATLAGRGVRAVGKAAMMLLACLGLATQLFAQAPGVHYQHTGALPPGAIGSWQLQRGGPLPGYYQPVEIKAPPGALISLATTGQFEPSAPAPVTAGMLIGAVYRLKVVRIPFHEGAEVFPTIEVVDRLYPPARHVWRFPIPIEITQEDLQLALAGKFVTRVIYLENPQTAVPAPENPADQHWFDVRPGENPLAVADTFGRPVAILRIGGRVPVDPLQPDPAFLFNSPPFLKFVPPQPVPPQVPLAGMPSAAAQAAGYEQGGGR
jgi:hypothetical protein